MPIIATDPELPTRQARRVTPEVVSSPPAVPQKADALTRFCEDPAALKASALDVLSIKVKPVETAQAAADLSNRIVGVATLIKDIDARRLMIVEPLKKQAKAVDEEARRWREPLIAWNKNAERVVIAFQKLDADRKQRAEEARQEAIREAAKKQQRAEIMQDTAAAEEASVAIMHAEATAPAEPIRGFKTDAGSTSLRRRWTFEVVDESLVPPMYLVPDPKLIQAAVDAGAREIEGCNIYEAESLTKRIRT